MIYHLVNPRPNPDARVQRAMKSWEVLCKEGVHPLHYTASQITAKIIGDSRDLPNLVEMLEWALLHTAKDNDIIMLTNDDDVLARGLPNFVSVRLAEQPAICAFRTNLPDGKPDYGRDLFAFDAWFLRQLLYYRSIPNMWLGEFEWDLILTVIIRRQLGIPIEKTSDFHKLTRAELPLGLVMHERHEAAWQSPAMKDAPAKMWNRLHAREWYHRNEYGHLCTV